MQPDQPGQPADQVGDDVGRSDAGTQLPGRAEVVQPAQAAAAQHHRQADRERRPRSRRWPGCAAGRRSSARPPARRTSDRYATPSATGSFTIAPSVQSTIASQRRGTLLPAPDRASASPLTSSAAATASRCAPATRWTSTSGLAAMAMTTTARRERAGHPRGDRDQDHDSDQRDRRAGSAATAPAGPPRRRPSGWRRRPRRRAAAFPASAGRPPTSSAPGSEPAHHGVGRVQPAAGQLTLRHVGVRVAAADDRADGEGQRPVAAISAAAFARSRLRCGEPQQQPPHEQSTGTAREPVEAGNRPSWHYWGLRRQASRASSSDYANPVRDRAGPTPPRPQIRAADPGRQMRMSRHAERGAAARHGSERTVHW